MNELETKMAELSERLANVQMLIEETEIKFRNSRHCPTVNDIEVARAIKTQAGMVEIAADELLFSLRH